MSTIKINELATSSINLSDFIVKADSNGLATKNTVQGLADVISTVGNSEFKGSLAIADTPSANGWYFPNENGTYTNAGDVVVSLANNLNIIIVSGTQDVFELLVIPVTVALEDTTYDKTDNVNGATMKLAFDQISSEIALQTNAVYISGTITTNVGIGNVVDFTVTSNTSALHGIIDCVEGNSFYLKGSGGNSPRLWVFLNSANEVISESAANLNTFASPVIITAPSGAIKAVFNTFTNDYPTAYILKLESTFKQLDLEKSARESKDIEIEKTLLKDKEVTYVLGSFISSSTEEPVANTDYNRTTAIALDVLNRNQLYVSLGNQGGSVSPVSYYSSSTLTEANFISSQIDTVNSGDEQLIKVKLEVPINATHFVLSTQQAYFIKLYSVLTNEELINAYKNVFITNNVTTAINNSLDANIYGGESVFLQQRSSSLLNIKSDSFDFVQIYGQSNADGRALYSESPSWFTDLGGLITNVKVWNRELNKFQSYEKGVNTGAENNTDTRHGFDIHFYKLWIDANPGKTLYVFKKTVGGTSIFNEPVGASSWNAKTETITVGKRHLCTEAITELKNMVIYCDLNNIKLNQKAILYHQGESDADNGGIGLATYLQNAKNLFSWYRGLFITPKLPLINGQIFSSNANYDAINSDFATLNGIDDRFKTVNMVGESCRAGDVPHFNDNALSFMASGMFTFYNTFYPTY